MIQALFRFVKELPGKLKREEGNGSGQSSQHGTLEALDVDLAEIRNSVLRDQFIEGRDLNPLRPRPAVLFGKPALGPPALRHCRNRRGFRTYRQFPNTVGGAKCLGDDHHGLEPPKFPVEVLHATVLRLNAHNGRPAPQEQSGELTNACANIETSISLLDKPGKEFRARRYLN